MKTILFHENYIVITSDEKSIDIPMTEQVFHFIMILIKLNKNWIRKLPLVSLCMQAFVA